MKDTKKESAPQLDAAQDYSYSNAGKNRNAPDFPAKGKFTPPYQVSLNLFLFKEILYPL